MNNKNKLVIGFNSDLYHNSETEAKQRRKIIAELNHFFSRYEINPPQPTELMVTSRKNSHQFVKLFLAKYKAVNPANFPNHYTELQELSVLTSQGIELSDLRRLQRDWDTLRLPFDFKALKSAVVDFNIYAENEKEIERFNHANELLKSINNFWDVYGVQGSSKAIREISKNALIFDIHTAQPIVNISWIKQQTI